MLNAYDHEDAEPLKASVEHVVSPVRKLIDRASEQGVDVLYVNDNFGDWSAGREQIVEAALNGTARELVEPIAPPAGSLFVVKARHSIFYQTPLEYMLRQQDIDHLILVGQVTEQCILYSALDGHVRHFDIVIPRDCVAHIHEGLADAALRMMETNMGAHVVPSEQALDAAQTRR
ncbi:MAG: cysteine hydrolase [Actinomycetota bacterium]|nr:cysteine hydrolase [Actinomycetota bacterium]